MSAVRSGVPSRGTVATLCDIKVDRLDAVLAIEVQAYAFAWSRGNFIDSMAAGYLTRMLVDADGEVLGYFIAMPGYEEMHLLNLTVAPRHEGRGHARTMLAALYDAARDHAASAVWLEVRESNARARSLYLREGFTEEGRRPGYYPAPLGQREDAILMSMRLGGGAAHGDEEHL